MIADEPTSAYSNGDSPVSRPGSKNFPKIKKAKPRPTIAANPRNRATAMTTTANAAAITPSGSERSKS
jgi:hypothetical protein